MTHLSDYSFVQRGVSNGWFFLWYLIYVGRYDRFEALSPRRIARFELRSIVTLLLLIAIPLHMAYDIGISSIKYQEATGKPSFQWTRPNQDLAAILDYILACGMALLTSIFFLLQSFWNYISKSVTKSSFMSSFEFKINIICSLIVVAVFPLIQFLFRNNHAYREAAPQMAFSIVLLVIALLGVRTHFRFKSLLKVALLTISESTQGVAEKLEYFKDMNLVLTFAMFGTGISLGIASADGLSPHPVIAMNKFASDFLVTNLNFFEFIIWVTLVMIFYPRRSGVGSPFGSSGGGTMSRTGPATSVAMHRYNGNNSKGNDYVFAHGQSNHNPGPAPTTEQRPPSHIPYKAPESRMDVIDLDGPTSPKGRLGNPYNDTYPLTQSTQHDPLDIVQMNAFKDMYDDPSPQKPTSSVKYMQSPPQSPIGHQFRSGSPSPYAAQRQQTSSSGQTTLTSPSSGPGYGSPVPRHQLVLSPTPAHLVNQQSFVLQDAPGSSNNRVKMALQQQQIQQMQQQQQQQNHPMDYDHPRSSTPTRSRKEPRSTPQY